MANFEDLETIPLGRFFLCQIIRLKNWAPKAHSNATYTLLFLVLIWAINYQAFAQKSKPLRDDLC
ncbi:hypothetical protein DIKCMJMK_03986 [Shewanella oneidensis]|nr:hypothetical protein [Shewanella oneidensis]